MRFPIVHPLSPMLLSSLLAAQGPEDLAGSLPAETPVMIDLVDGSACVQNFLDLLDPLPPGTPLAGRVALWSLPLAVRMATGSSLPDLLATVAPGQVALAQFPSDPPFPVLLSQITDPDAVGRLLRRIPPEWGVHAAVANRVLTVSDSAAHLRAALRFQGSGQPSLLARAGFREGRAEMAAGKGLRFFLDTDALRRRSGSSGIWATLDRGARVLLGPAVRPLDLASRVDGTLSLEADRMVLAGRIDAGLGQDPQEVGRLTAAGREGRVVPPAPPGTLVSLGLDRDFGALLRDPGAWLDQDGVLGVRQFLSTVDQFLGGASLLGDLLPGIAMPVHVFLTEAGPEDEVGGPRIRLPTGVLVFALGEDQARAADLLRRAFATVAGLVNITRVQEGKSSVTLRTERRGSYRPQRLRFADWDGPGDAPTEQGLSPTLLFAHGYGILSSGIEGAVEMAETLAGSPETEGRRRGDLLVLRGAAIARVLAANAPVLELQRVLQEGDTREEAVAFFRVLRAVVGVLEFRAQVVPGPDSTDFSLDLRRVARRRVIR